MHDNDRAYGAIRLLSHLRDAGFADDDIPSAKQLENHIYSYRKNKLGRNNSVGDVEVQLNPFVFTGNEDLKQPFLFGYRRANDGQLLVGTGTDYDPVYLMFTSKALLSVLNVAICNRNTTPVVLHADSTYKLNQNEFPLLVIGVSDGTQAFHPLCFGVLSHHNNIHYTRAFNDLYNLFCTIFNYEPTVDYVVTDCDHALRYGLHCGFRVDEEQHIMCFFHVVKACKEKLKGKESTVTKRILEEIRNLRTSTNEHDFQTKYNLISGRWIQDGHVDFKLYFERQWINMHFRIGKSIKLHQE
jgi:hypothetical protein